MKVHDGWIYRCSMFPCICPYIEIDRSRVIPSLEEYYLFCVIEFSPWSRNTSLKTIPIYSLSSQQHCGGRPNFNQRLGSIHSHLPPYIVNKHILCVCIRRYRLTCAWCWSRRRLSSAKERHGNSTQVGTLPKLF